MEQTRVLKAKTASKKSQAVGGDESFNFYFGLPGFMNNPDWQLTGWFIILPANRRLTMLKGFRQFIMRGNVIDLAVAVVIGAAFGAVVTAFVTNILTPLIAAIVGKPDFSAFSFTVNGAVISYGVFLNALISFLLIAAAVYFFMVAPMNAWKARAARNAVSADPASKKCPECMSEVPIGARRCAFCTSVIATQTQLTPGNA